MPGGLRRGAAAERSMVFTQFYLLAANHNRSSYTNVNSQPISEIRERKKKHRREKGAGRRAGSYL